MNELQINATLNEGSIITNIEELKTKLSAKMAEYENAVFTEDSKTIAKAELAGLRKLKDAVEKRRKEIKKQCMIPYNEFEKEAKELVEIIDRPIRLIDAQIKEMEEVRIQKRRGDVRTIYDETIGEHKEYLPFNEIYDKKWDLAGTSLKKIREDIEQLLTKTIGELSILTSNPSDVKDEAIEMYKKTRDLTGALSYINTYETNKAKALKVEAEKRIREEEQRRQEEIERAKREEREKMMEIERARAEERKIAERKLESVKYEGEPIVPFDPEDDDDLPFTQPNTITAFYKVVASPKELENVEMAFNSIGIYFERRDA